MPQKKPVCSIGTGCDVESFEGLRVKYVLNCILPPREWMENGKHWRQKISNKPVSKLKSKELGENLDTYLKRLKAKEVGICPIKRELYSHCFNEIIRQVTLECAQQGYMLVEIRNEINMTVDTHQKLIEKSMATGMLNTLKVEHKKTYLKLETDTLKKDNDTLERNLAEIKQKTVQLEQEMAVARDAEIKSHAKKMEALKKTRQSLKDQLECFIRGDLSEE